MEGVLKHIGAPGEKNGVEISFGNLKNGAGSGPDAQVGKDGNITFDSKATQSAGVLGNAVTLAHEGLHSAQNAAWGPTTTIPGPRGSYARELDAYNFDYFIGRANGLDQNTLRQSFGDYLTGRAWDSCTSGSTRNFDECSEAHLSKKIRRK